MRSASPHTHTTHTHTPHPPLHIVQDTSLLHMGSMYHAQRLFDKLARGERIVATAFGSSLVHEYRCGHPCMSTIVATAFGSYFA